MPKSLLEFMGRHGGLDAVCAGAHPIGRRVSVPDALPDSLPHFECRCGRIEAAFMVREIEPRDVPPGLRLTREERERCGFGEDDVRCSACCETAVSFGRISDARMREARGLPARRMPKTHEGRGH